MTQTETPAKNLRDLALTAYAGELKAAEDARLAEVARERESDLRAMRTALVNAMPERVQFEDARTFIPDNYAAYEPFTVDDVPLVIGKQHTGPRYVVVAFHLPHGEDQPRCVNVQNITHLGNLLSTGTVEDSADWCVMRKSAAHQAVFVRRADEAARALEGWISALPE